MDELGVLVNHYGIKPKGKSLPMAASKTAPKSHNNYNSVIEDPIFSTSTHNSNSGIGSLLDDQNDDIFGLNTRNYAIEDVFQMPINNSNLNNESGGGGVGGSDIDVESVFKGLNIGANSSNVNDDVNFWGSSEKGSTSVAVGSDDLLSSDPVDDFWRQLGQTGLDHRGVKRLDENKVNNVDIDDLVPGFGRSNTANNRAQASSTENNSGVASPDFLGAFVTGNPERFTPKNVLKKKVKHKETNFIDIDGSLNDDDLQHEEVNKSNEYMFQPEAPDLEFIFGTHTQKSEKAVNLKAEETPDLIIETRNLPDDFPSIFGDALSHGQFKEIEGESDSRREARYQRYRETELRMANAVAEMNQREIQAKQEQEERHRVAETMDVELQRWAAGKEGNLRALLSSLQLVLGPEYGWLPLTLADLITSSQVKIAYKKAALCVHPDKVQQKGAQQKYVAEKIFDLLKEAWNKFNKEELR